MTPWILGVGSVCALAGAVAWGLWRRRQNEAAWPTTWLHVGTPPAGADEALEILCALAPGPVRRGGTIEWVEEPFLSWGVLVAGVELSALPVHVRVTRIEPVEESALAHEIGHAFWEQVYGHDGEGTGNFVAWVAEANAAIRRAREAA